MTSECISKLVLYFGGEVKVENGPAEETQGQHYTFLLAGILNLRTLRHEIAEAQDLKAPLEKEPSLPLF